MSFFVMYGRSLAWISSTHDNRMVDLFRLHEHWIYIYILLTVTNRNIRKWYYNSFQVPVDILQAIPSDLSQFIETLHSFIIRAITKSVQTKTQSNFGETQSVIFAYLLFSLPIFNRITFKSSCYCYTKTNRLIFATLNTWKRQEYQGKNEPSFSLFIIATIPWSNKHVKHSMV